MCVWVWDARFYTCIYTCLYVVLNSGKMLFHFLALTAIDANAIQSVIRRRWTSTVLPSKSREKHAGWKSRALSLSFSLTNTTAKVDSENSSDSTRGSSCVSVFEFMCICAHCFASVLVEVYGRFSTIRVIAMLDWKLVCSLNVAFCMRVCMCAMVTEMKRWQFPFRYLFSWSGNEYETLDLVRTKWKRDNHSFTFHRSTRVRLKTLV